MVHSEFNLADIVRPNILALKPYRCARDDYSEGILLDANENSYGPALASQDISSALINEKVITETYSSDFHLERYPDPHQHFIKTKLAQLRGLKSTHHFFLGVGSDESIDLAIRIFCRPGVDKILITPPTYGMYSVCAQVNDVAVVKCPLLVNDFQFQANVDEILNIVEMDPLIKIIFLCSPGNPTGVLLNPQDIKRILESTKYKGVVIVDEAYIDFVDYDSSKPSASVASWVEQYPNLIVTQTFSKSFGLAGIRLGVSISSPEIAQIFNNTKAPYNISTPTSLMGRDCLSEEGLARMRTHVQLVIRQREWLRSQLQILPDVMQVGPSDSNFLLVQFADKAMRTRPDSERAQKLYKVLAESHGVVIRYRGNELGCEGCLRMTVGTAQENETLIEKLKIALELF